MRQYTYLNYLLLGCLLICTCSSCARFRPTASRQIDANPTISVGSTRTTRQNVDSSKKGNPQEDIKSSRSIKQVSATENTGLEEASVAFPDDSPQQLNPVIPPPAPASVDGSVPIELEAIPSDASVSTLEQLEQLALSNNPTLVQAHAAINAAHGKWTQVGLYPNPLLLYQGNEIGNGGKPGLQGGAVRQPIVTAGKLGLNRETASYEISQANSNYQAQQYRVLTSVRIAYYDVLVAQQRIKLTKQLLGLSNKGVEVAEALIAAQQEGKVDLYQARVEANKSRVLLRQATNEKRSALQRLESLIGAEQYQASNLTGKWEPMPMELKFSEVLATIEASSPELSAANANVFRANAKLRRAEVEPIPDIFTQLGVQNDTESGYTVANVILGIKLPLFNRNQGNIQSAQAELTAAARNIDRVKLGLKNRLANTIKVYNSSKYEIERYSKEIIPDAKSSLELVTSGYEKGEFDYNRLLTAQRTYFQTNIAYLQAIQSWWTAKLEIDGLLLRGGLNSQP